MRMYRVFHGSFIRFMRNERPEVPPIKPSVLLGEPQSPLLILPSLCDLDSVVTNPFHFRATYDNQWCLNYYRRSTIVPYHPT